MMLSQRRGMIGAERWVRNGDVGGTVGPHPLDPDGCTANAPASLVWVALAGPWRAACKGLTCRSPIATWRRSTTRRT